MTLDAQQTKMAGADVDFEGAFTSGDPEALLDLLAIRSLRMRHSDDDVSIASVPIFPSENDMEAFVRTFTIDNTISDCFAGLPSSCDVNSPKSDHMSLTSRPEKKLIASSAETMIFFKGEPLSDSKGRSTAEYQPIHIEEPHAALNASGSNTKSRGFLASLLARRTKGRRIEGRKKSVLRHNDVPAGDRPSARPPPAEKTTTSTSASHDPGYLSRDLQNRASETKMAVGNVDGIQCLESTHLSQAGGSLGRFQDKNAAILLRDGCTVGEVMVHQLDTASVQDHHSPPCRAENLTSAAPGRTEHHIPLSAGVSAHGTDKGGMVGGQKFPLKEKSQVSTDSGNLSSGLHVLKVEEKKQQVLTDKPPLPTARNPLWGGWSDGIDSFIDFERDPNLELPLDSHFSSKFEFERKSDHEAREDSGRTYESLTTALPKPDISASCALTSQISSEPMTSKKRLPPTQVSGDEPSTFGAVTEPDVTSHVHMFAPILRASASTQTEERKCLQSATDWKPRALHCLQTAITQLSTLSSCSACESIVSRTVGDLRRVLIDMEGGDASPNDLTSTSQSFLSLQGKSDSDTNSEVDVSAAALKTNRGERMQFAESDSSGTTTQGAKVLDMEVAQKDQTVDNETRANKRTDTIVSQHQHQRQDTETQPTTTSLLSNDNTEKPNKDPGHHTAEKFVTSSHVLADSDSDSTSTVTSEPATVRMRPKRSRGLSVHSLSAGTSTLNSHPSQANADGDSDDIGRKRKLDVVSSASSSVGEWRLRSANNSDVSSGRAAKQGATKNRDISPKSDTPCRRTFHYAGAVDGDCESFVTSSWSEMTSVSSVCDVVTSADESSYYSGDDDNDDADDDDEEEDEDDDVTTMVRLGLQDEDRDDSELRHQRLQRHLEAVLRQSTTPSATVETVVVATGERLNSQGRYHTSHVNQGTMYPFSASSCLATPSNSENTPLPVALTEQERGECAHTGRSSDLPLARGAKSREARPLNASKKGGATPRLFSPDRQVSLVSARQMTSDEFREGYDRSSDIAKVKRSQLDGDVPWDQLQFSDTDDDAASDKAWYDVTSEEESAAHAYSTDTDSSANVSDW